MECCGLLRFENVSCDLDWGTGFIDVAVVVIAGLVVDLVENMDTNLFTIPPRLEAFDLCILGVDVCAVDTV